MDRSLTFNALGGVILSLTALFEIQCLKKSTSFLPTACMQPDDICISWVLTYQYLKQTYNNFNFVSVCFVPLNLVIL